jgi:hypothetical protein
LDSLAKPGSILASNTPTEPSKLPMSLNQVPNHPDGPEALSIDGSIANGEGQGTR